MLFQGLDYYDYVSTHREAFARLYKTYAPDPAQQVRLLLIAPSFSPTLVNRCKWIDVPLSLFTFTCIKFDGSDEIIPVFTEHEIPSAPEPPKILQLPDHLTYITDDAARSRASRLLDEVKAWKAGRIALDAVKSGISLKVDGHVFAYFYPRRKYFMIATYNSENTWTDYPVHGDDEIPKSVALMMAAMEARAQ
jgi:hypothetical protein